MDSESTAHGIDTLFKNLKLAFQSSKHVFTWKVPSITLDEKVRICNGYARRFYSGYIPTPILAICALFYSNDTYTINDIKTLRDGRQHHIYSPPFILDGEKWFVPNM